MRLWPFSKEPTTIEFTETMGDVSTVIRVSSKDPVAAVTAFGEALKLRKVVVNNTFNMRRVSE